MSTKNINLELKVTDNLSGAVNTVITKQNNVLLAEFMGFKHCPEIGKDVYINSAKKEQIRASVIGYNDDWNCLMEVVEKIENLKINKFAKQLNRADVKPIYGHFWFQTSKNVVEIYASVYYWQHDNQINGLTQKFKGKTKIEATYNACVEFVKWYNTQNIKS